MSGDANSVIMTANGVPTCPSIRACFAHHRIFPEILGEGETPEGAATSLLHHLTAALDSVGSERHRELVRRAILDVGAFLAGATAPGTSARAEARPLD